MFEITPVAGWESSLSWLIGVGMAAFLVTWVLTDRLDVHRAVYVGALAVLTAGLSAGYVVWASAGGDVWGNRWLWGILAGVLAGVLLDVMVSRMIPRRIGGHVGSAQFAWETAVYGVAEGLLLSVLPVLITWQIFAAVGWTSGWTAVGAAVAALLASLVVIVVHHLGYAEFRSRRMVQAVIGCSVLSIVYLLTGSPLSAVLGHIVLHAGLLRQGQVLPPDETFHPGAGRRGLTPA
jgi:hypothetical protein